ncbi:MAG: hypothetical protein Q8R70_10185 [Methanoregula sp.]|nr:hypothetical protein [Methanoregula sp.]
MSGGAGQGPVDWRLLAFWCLLNRFSLLPSIGGAFGIWMGALLVMNRIVAGA